MKNNKEVIFKASKRHKAFNKKNQIKNIKIYALIF